MNDSIENVQREVQRKLGRCMLRLQQVERILKALVAHTSIQGEPQQLQSILEKQIADTKTSTLGALVKEMFASILVNSNLADDEPETTEVADKIRESCWYKSQYQISISAEDYALTKQEWKDFVDMRNELAHHFFDRFDIASVSGCKKADAHLVDCDAKIEQQLTSLKRWATNFEEARAIHATCLNSPEFTNALLHGRLPDGMIVRPVSTIVECLRNAELVCGLHGWTLLDTAIAHIRNKEPEQIPSKYGCKTWRQVLKRSAQFEIRADVNPLNDKGQVWYRSIEEISLN